jgi:NAD(P)-dependent dehydrogenase (short-subunit alcohol dehydrogenase family)
MSPGLIDRLLDKTIALSFDRTGYLRHARGYDPDDLDVDLAGRQIAVTGANSGLGYATTAALAARGATVWMLCRDARRGADARDRLLTAHPGADLRLHAVDVSDWESVDACGDDLPTDRLDVLVHNAGALVDARVVLPNGLERTLATNLVGPYRLTHRLLGRLEAAPAPRVVHVSSGGMYGVKLDLAALEGTRGSFDGVKAYAYTKRGQVVLTEQLAERWADRGIAVHAMHPGWADTPGVKGSIPTFHALTQAILRTPEQGADTTVWLAAVADIPGPSGTFWFDRAPADPHLSRLTRVADDVRARFWDQLQDWAGV